MTMQRDDIQTEIQRIIGRTEPISNRPSIVWDDEERRHVERPVAEVIDRDIHTELLSLAGNKIADGDFDSARAVMNTMIARGSTVEHIENMINNYVDHPAVQGRPQMHPEDDYDQALDQANNVVPPGVEVQSDKGGGTYVCFPAGMPLVDRQRIVNDVGRIMEDAEPEGITGYIEGDEEDYENYVYPQDLDAEDDDDYAPEEMDNASEPIPGFHLDSTPPEANTDNNLQDEVDRYKDAQEQEREAERAERQRDRAQEYRGMPQEPVYRARGGRGDADMRGR